MNGKDFKEETCAQYWPQRRGELKWEHFFIQMDEETEEDHMCVQTLKLINGAKPNEEAREIRHFQFEGWRMYEKVSAIVYFDIK